mmetsp:Transcript_62634/g.166212  ORF Transcript_62634/g.166212 Transcript_62634/m.166212 type:complete len:82 (+) Transcript_62634:167-412(+)
MEERVPSMSERDCTTHAVDYNVNDDKSVGDERQHEKKQKKEPCSGKKKQHATLGATAANKLQTLWHTIKTHMATSNWEVRS